MADEKTLSNLQTMAAEEADRIIDEKTVADVAVVAERIAETEAEAAAAEEAASASSRASVEDETIDWPVVQQADKAHETGI